MTNREFAASDPLFRKACELAYRQPTSRQASKWRMKKGIARIFQGSAQRVLEQESEKEPK